VKRVIEVVREPHNLADYSRIAGKHEMEHLHTLFDADQHLASLEDVVELREAQISKGSTTVDGLDDLARGIRNA
jgi:hypothetical protein